MSEKTPGDYQGMALVTTGIEETREFNHGDLATALNALKELLNRPIRPTRLVPIVPPFAWMKYMRGEITEAQLWDYAIGYGEEEIKPDDADTTD